MKRLLAATAMISTLAGAAVSLSATPAAAYVVCNRAGECWDNDHHWRDYHEGRGYYREGIWVPF